MANWLAIDRQRKFCSMVSNISVFSNFVSSMCLAVYHCFPKSRRSRSFEGTECDDLIEHSLNLKYSSFSLFR